MGRPGIFDSPVFPGCHRCWHRHLGCCLHLANKPLIYCTIILGSSYVMRGHLHDLCGALLVPRKGYYPLPSSGLSRRVCPAVYYHGASSERSPGNTGDEP